MSSVIPRSSNMDKPLSQYLTTWERDLAISCPPPELSTPSKRTQDTQSQVFRTPSNPEHSKEQQNTSKGQGLYRDRHSNILLGSQVMIERDYYIVRVCKCVYTHTNTMLLLSDQISNSVTFIELIAMTKDLLEENTLLLGLKMV